ncbi:hypothetical protein [Nocardioides piscis]|uniref:Uncharacterized protein n=1 Tax=Nocardioides piscis TaxID=2714938 RepID=A0A6G7YK13_9ACTN|nr:hypothetical protein [Nocardioides piscis]QIK77084.1 hypothetical protein G7071_18230 [Nocardioides piscis]
MDALIAQRRGEVADFQRRWHRFARRWRGAAGRDLAEARSLVESALARGLPTVGDDVPIPRRRLSSLRARGPSSL